ncbi:hypothetical protein CALCODRAFT_556723 [Calocera cornea HHB12733]|uniref:Uncharacterized protein n=1 Tax=Calocera cornea HHB12733 TaxID=1353952 RepID=A0A165EGK0_9BASI|nr:hypothetical protein CALCODRAFT_556723 [Calocera cornea HHB12733]
MTSSKATVVSRSGKVISQQSVGALSVELWYMIFAIMEEEMLDTDARHALLSILLVCKAWKNSNLQYNDEDFRDIASIFSQARNLISVRGLRTSFRELAALSASCANTLRILYVQTSLHSINFPFILVIAKLKCIRIQQIFPFFKLQH